MQRVEDNVRRGGSRGLARVEPRGRRRKVEAPRHPLLRRRGTRRDSDGQNHEASQRGEEALNLFHLEASLPCQTLGWDARTAATLSACLTFAVSRVPLAARRSRRRGWA